MNGHTETTLSKSAAHIMAEYYQLPSLEQRKVADLIFAANRAGNGFGAFVAQPHVPLFAATFASSPGSSPSLTGTNNNAWSAAPREVIEQIKQPPPAPTSMVEDAEDGDINYIRVCDNEKCRCRYYLTKNEIATDTTPELNLYGVVVFDVQHPEDADQMDDKKLCRWVYGYVADALSTKTTHIRVERLWVRANRRVVDVHFKSHNDAVRGMLRLRKQGFSVNWMRARSPSLHHQEEDAEN